MAIPQGTTAISRPSLRSRAVLRLLAITVLLPLAVVLLGLWEQRRGADELAAAEAQQGQIAQIVATLEARPPPRAGGLDIGTRFSWDGHAYVGALAIEKAREARSEIGTGAWIARMRNTLPPVVTASAALAAVVSALILLIGFLLGQAGRRSRNALVRGFSLMRPVLPAALALQVLLATVAFVAVAAFEAVVLVLPGHITGGGIKMAALAGMAILFSLWIAGSTALQLRKTLAAFTPDPLPILGRAVPREAAPGLWRLLDGLAERLGALQPDHVVVGLTEGFFVSSGPKLLEPGGEALEGRTLYLPLPYLPLLRPDEIVTIIGHELAHFSGGDTEYSLRFLPIYVSVERSLVAVAQGGADGRGAGSPLLSPALQLGTFVMDQFHLAVRHWSRQREFAADAAGASLTSAAASARALLRSAAIQPRITETLESAADAPETAPDDLVAAAFRHAVARGLDDPAAHLDAEQPHPTDTHPPTRQRIAALDHPLDAELLAAAAVAPSGEALAGLRAFFTEPEALCRAASADFLNVVRRNAAAFQAHLEATVADVGTEEQVLRENTRAGAGVFLAASGLFAVFAGGVFAMPGLSTGERQLVAALALLIGLGFLGYGFFRRRREERPFLILRPEALAVPGLDRPIAWDQLADLDMTFVNARMVTRLMLLPDMPLPERLKSARRVKLDRKRHAVSVTAVLPRGMKPQDFADLITRYRQAAAARQFLAQKHAAKAPQVEATVG